MMAQISAPLYRAPDKATFAAAVVYRSYSPMTLAQLWHSIKRVAPQVEVGDWTGPIVTVPHDDREASTVSIDGVKLAIVNQDMRLPPDFFDPGPIQNFMFPNPEAVLAGQTGHALIIPAEAPQSTAAAVRTARSVSLLILAIAGLKQAQAFKWMDANLLVPMDALHQQSASLVAAHGSAVPAWIRVLAGARTQPNGQRRVAVGTYGLWAFDKPEIELAPSNEPLEHLIPRAFAICDYVLGTDRTLSQGDTLSLDGVTTWTIAEVQDSSFTNRRVVRLTPNRNH